MDNNNKQILVVDDNETFCQTMARVLKRSGFTTHTAFNLSQATQIANEHYPDYAIVDLKIANESGLVLISQLLEIKADIRIVILTGYASIATAVEAIKLGAVQYLTKPVDTSDVLNALLGEAEGQDDVEIPDEPMSVKRLEWEHLQKVLADNQGNISATAKALNMHRRTLQRKLQKHAFKE